MAVTAGDPAPTFELPGTFRGERRTYSLGELRGRTVVLAFYPGDNTPVCTRQLNAYTADVHRFAELDASILAISPQDLDSHDGFAASQGGFAFPLLADVDKAVARAYGVLGPVGFYRRCTFVVDPHGRLAYVHRDHAAGTTFRSSEELAAAIRSADAAG
jgi:peroxiredoxin Q/BCP